MAGAERKWRTNLSSVILGQPKGLTPANIHPGSMPLSRKKNLRSAAMPNFPELNLTYLSHLGSCARLAANAGWDTLLV
jgi:hypothetical protein